MGRGAAPAPNSRGRGGTPPAPGPPPPPSPSSSRYRSAAAPARLDLPDPRFELRASVGAIVTILDDHGRRQRESPVASGANRDGAGPRNDHRPFRHDQRLSRLR